MPRTLTGVYRFQLTPDDDFDRAAKLVPYLRELGISHLYTSPIAEAEPGSVHGYDVTDPTLVRAELGGEAGLRRMLDALATHDMGWILDIVPNHVSIATPARNPWFRDVLAHGRESAFAEMFDIDWDGPQEDRLVLPVLSDYFDRALADGSIEVDRTGPGAEIVVAGGLRLPTAPGTADDASSGLRDVLAAQHYRLVFWQREIRNMRRFFEIDTLAALAVERPRVRDQVHALTLRLARDEPTLTGVRVDHLDGLADPDEYLQWLRAQLGPKRTIHVEKILVGDEAMPRRWPVDGTTGYEFARLVDQVLVDEDGLRAVRAHWRQLTDESRSYDDVERSSIEEVLTDRLAPDVARLHRLVRHRPRLAGAEGRSAIVKLVAHLGRYRTYLPHGPDDGQDDISVIHRAADAAVRDGGVSSEVIADLVDALTAPSGEAERDARTRFQQLTGPALAKGGEDRALYRWTPLPALNEVGGDPGDSGASTARFHVWAREAQRRFPLGLLCTTTHDTKRSGDVRARLVTLTRDPQDWFGFVDDFAAKAPGIHPADAWLLAATMFGAWPIDASRLVEYMTKAVREGATRSSWSEPDVAYEEQIGQLIRTRLASADFVHALDDLVARRFDQGLAVTMAQVLVRLTAPGVGDVYRGDELLDLSLVDPDNRRPVDWDRTRKRLDDAKGADLAAALRGPNRGDGLAKLTLISRTLEVRGRHLSSFGPKGEYEALSEHDPTVLAYRRGDVLVVVARGAAGDSARQIVLPPGTWRHCLVDGRAASSGETLADGLVTDEIPVALLERDPH